MTNVYCSRCDRAIELIRECSRAPDGIVCFQCTCGLEPDTVDCSVCSKRLARSDSWVFETRFYCREHALHAQRAYELQMEAKRRDVIDGAAIDSHWSARAARNLRETLNDIKRNPYALKPGETDGLRIGGRALAWEYVFPVKEAGLERLLGDLVPGMNAQLAAPILLAAIKEWEATWLKVHLVDRMPLMEYLKRCRLTEERPWWTK